ncbi:MAG: sigma factor-like helix-turn-helix DNA-binding protein, partial [Byssovorax sp.]
ATPYLERVVCDGLDEEPPSSRSPAVRRMSEALDQLSERERDVLRVSALHYRAGEHQRLPNADSAELAGRWGTTNDNIRAIRVRAMKKLKELLLSQPTGKTS